MSTLKKQFIQGFNVHNLSSLLSPVTLIYCIFGCIITNMISTVIMIELLILVDIYCNKKDMTRHDLVLFFARYCISRCIMIMLLFLTIDDNFWLILVGSPIFLSWYVFDPYLIRNKRLSFTERIDYFVSRFPFFIGYACVPFIPIIIWYITDINYFIYLAVCIMIRYHSTATTPKCYLSVPYTKVTYKTDPADIAEEYISKFF